MGGQWRYVWTAGGLLLSAFATLLIVALGSATQTGRAYVPIRVSNGNATRWFLDSEQPNVSGGRIIYFVDEAATIDNLAAAPVTAFDAVTASFQRWEDLDASGIAFRYDGKSSGTLPNGDDRKNIVIWRTPAQFSGLGAGVFAITVTTFEASGQITDADMMLNETFPWWTSKALDQSPTGTAGKADIENIVTHEAGHLLGLDHSYVGHSTMYALSDTGFINLRSIEADDIAGMSELYPHSSSANYGAITGRVLRTSQTALFGAHVVAIDANTLQAKVGAHALKNSDFAIRGVPPGNYYLFIGGMRRGELGQAYYGSITESFVHELVGINEPLVQVTGVPTLFPVAAGQTVNAGDLVCETTGSPGENDDTPSRAITLALGQYAASQLENSQDVDWYTVPSATSDRQVILSVDAWDLGSALDPYLELFTSANPSTPVITSDDRDDVGFDLSGANVDPRIGSESAPYTIAAGTTVLLKVSSFNKTSSGYYLISARIPGGGEISPTASAITAEPGSLKAGGGGTSTITVTLKNALGHPVSAATPVTLTTSAGTLPGGATFENLVETSVGSGQYPSTLSAGAAEGTATLTVQVGAVTLTPATVYFTGDADPAQSTLAISKSTVPADGQSSTLMILTPKDSGGRPVRQSGLTVAFTATGSAVAQGAVTMNNATGAYEQLLVAPTVAEVATVTASLDLGQGAVALPPAQSRTVTFSTDAGLVADAAQSTISASPISVPAGAAKSLTVIILAKNASGQTLTHSPDVTLYFADASGGETTGHGALSDASELLLGAQAEETTAGGGTFTATLGADATPDSQRIGARIGAVALAAPVQVHFTGAPDATATTLGATPDEIAADAVSQVEIAVTPIDSGGRPVVVSSSEVSITTTAGTLLNQPAIDAATGRITQSLRAPGAGAVATVSATVGGVAVSKSATVTFVQAVPPPAAPGGSSSGGCGCGSSSTPASEWGTLLAVVMILLVRRLLVRCSR